jgi:mRNA interferase MazF
MAKFMKGDVVVLPFPFSDLSQAKRRPALVIAELEGDDVILVQITSQTIRDTYAIALSDSDFIEGSLNKPSNVRPNRLFTADTHIVLYRVGRISSAKANGITDSVISILKS